MTGPVRPESDIHGAPPDARQAAAALSPVTAPSTASASQGWWQSEKAHHGAQLVAAIVLAFAASSALRLPESLWAVMSALIVVRPTTGSTFGAGWDRVRGALAGMLVALAGVWLRHHLTLAAMPVTLAIVAALAYASAVVPSMRSAPISALIVLNSSGLGGHSATQVATLRGIEIVIGVAAGLAVSFLGIGARARGRFDRAAADFLDQLANNVLQAMQSPAPDAVATEATVTRTRAALRRLAELADAADRETRLLPRRGETGPADRHRMAVRILARTQHDASQLARVQALSKDADSPYWGSLAHAASGALHATADAIAGRAVRGDLSPLRALVGPQAQTGEGRPAVWAMAPIALLLQDLGALRSLVRPPPPLHLPDSDSFS